MNSRLALYAVLALMLAALFLVAFAQPAKADYASCTAACYSANLACHAACPTGQGAPSCNQDCQVQYGNCVAACPPPAPTPTPTPVPTPNAACVAACYSANLACHAACPLGQGAPSCNQDCQVQYGNCVAACPTN